MKRVSIALSNKDLEQISTYRPGKPIDELERELGVSNAVKLASNENALGPSPLALKAIQKDLPNLNRYPDGGAFHLRRKLAKHLDVNPEQILLGNGSDELIVLAIRAFISRGDEVLTAVPTFLIYRIATQVQGGKIVEIPMKSFRYDLKAMANAITKKTKIIFIANPDNPVGTYVDKKELKAFVKKVPKRCLIFLDEAYYEYAKGIGDYPDSIKEFKFSNVIVSRTFSKAYGLAGLRVGYGISSPEVINVLDKVREPFNVNQLAQVAALAALDDKSFLKKVIEQNDAEKKKLCNGLERMGFQVIPSATNFVLVNIGKRASFVYKNLLKKGYIVRFMRVWGLEEYIRISIGKPKENRDILSAMRSILSHK